MPHKTDPSLLLSLTYRPVSLHHKTPLHPTPPPPPPPKSPTTTTTPPPAYVQVGERQRETHNIKHLSCGHRSHKQASLSLTGEEKESKVQRKTWKPLGGKLIPLFSSITPPVCRSELATLTGLAKDLPACTISFLFFLLSTMTSLLRTFLTGH